ncbi:MAG: hypothetical protein K2K60_06550 [Clostridia bacterium]|nr:hypothetical protein [Clostridia bacterium]
MKVSLFYGMKVESSSGKRGYVISVNVNGGRLECLVCADEDENEFSVDVKNIISVKESIKFEDRESAIKASTPLRLGKPVYDNDGMYMGTLTDFSVEKNVLSAAFVGRKKFSADDLVCGDAVIVKSKARVLKSDVKKDGRVILKRGTPLTPEVLQKAQQEGEYVQTNLKTL